MFKELYRMALFTKIVENGSFSAAANQLGLGKSVVSQHVRALEERAGVRLINRSTRSFSLTTDGSLFYQHCLSMIENAEQAFNSVNPAGSDTTGILRLTAPHNLGLSFIVGLVHRFRDKYRNIEIDLSLDDSVLNLVQAQVDIAIRVGPLNDSAHHVVKLSGYELVLCAGKRFARNMLPATPEDLPALPWIELPRASIGHRLKLKNQSGATRTVKVSPVIRTNSGIAAQELIKAGDGIGILPDYSIRADLASGELLRVLPDWSLPSSNISAVFPSGQLSPRSRLFLDFAKAEFKRVFG